MTIELSRQVDKDLRAAVAGFEMEISDSVMEYLLGSIAAGLEETGTESPDGLVLLAMDSVARHVDVLRARSDPGAFILVEELWQAFTTIREGLDEQQARELAATRLGSVLDWQRDCYVDRCQQEQDTAAAPTDTVPAAVLAEVERHIAETREYVHRELAALRQATAGATLRGSFRQAEDAGRLAAAVNEQVSGLESLLREEMTRLRRELAPAGGQA
jgi:hypothetical protein